MLRWQDIVVLTEADEPCACDCCGRPARRIEGSLVHTEEPMGRYTVRWRPGEPRHPARYDLYLGDWTRVNYDNRAMVACADYRGGPDHGFTLRDDAAEVLSQLEPWRPVFVRRADAIGKPLGERLFAMLDAVHVKDPRLSEVRGWAVT